MSDWSHEETDSDEKNCDEDKLDIETPVHE
jgi:hypothetical protein